MPKFKVFECSQYLKSLLFKVHTNQKNDVSTKSANNSFFTSPAVYLILLILFNTQLSCAVKIFSPSSSEDFSAKLFAALAIIAMHQALVIFVNIGMNMPKIVVLHQTFQRIVDGECTSSA